jgi:pimeloyl-ACP methyl ester carboxylesterase
MTRTRLNAHMLLSVVTLACVGRSGPRNSTGPASAQVISVPSARPGLKAMLVNGTVLNYVDSVRPSADMTAPIVVFVHGSLGSYGDATAQLAAFSTVRRTVAYSRRYHVPNAVVDGGPDYSAELHAEDLTAFVRGLDGGPVVLVGESYGGLVALETARHHPELVRALVLAEPAALGLLARTPSGESFRRATMDGLIPLRQMLERGDSIGAMSAFVAGTGGPPNGLDGVSPSARSYLLTQMPEFRREMLAPSDVYEPALTCADLAPIRAPTLVLRSERASPLFSRIVDELSACLPTARIVTIPLSGHTMNRDNPTAFNTVILRFLAEKAH